MPEISANSLFGQTGIQLDRDQALVLVLSEMLAGTRAVLETDDHVLLYRLPSTLAYEEDILYGQITCDSDYPEHLFVVNKDTTKTLILMSDPERLEFISENSALVDKIIVNSQLTRTSSSNYDSPLTKAASTVSRRMKDEYYSLRKPS